MENYLLLYENSKEDRKNPYFSPLMEQNLSNMPDTLILTAEFDPLRDEGEEYGKRLKEAGNYVEVHRIPNALHGYFALGIRFFPCAGKLSAYECISGKKGRLTA